MLIFKNFNIFMFIFKFKQFSKSIYGLKKVELY